MKTDNIHVGFVAKNYRHMCSVLGEIESTGKSKQLQLKRWECYFDYEKQGNKLVVTEIHDIPKPLPKRGGNNVTPYLAQVKELIIQLLIYSGNQRITLPKYRLLEALNMINENYKKGKNQIDKLSNHTSIKKIDIYDFYNAADDMLKRNVEKSLDELQDKRAIFWSKVHMVSKNKKVEIATEDQKQMILYVQLEVLKEMGYEGLNEVFISGKIDEFNRRSNKKLYEKAEIQYTYEAYNIILNRERLKELVKLNKGSIREIGSNLNQSVILRLKQNSYKRHKKTNIHKDDWFGLHPENKKAYRAGDDFTDKQSKLIDILVNIEHVPIFNSQR